MGLSQTPEGQMPMGLSQNMEEMMTESLGGIQTLNDGGDDDDEEGESGESGESGDDQKALVEEGRED